MEESSQKIRLKFIKNFPWRVVGEDLKEYGEFSEGDVAWIPRKLGELMIKKGYAVAMIGNRPWYPRIHMKKYREEPEKKERQTKLNLYFKK